MVAITLPVAAMMSACGSGDDGQAPEIPDAPPINEAEPRGEPKVDEPVTTAPMILSSEAFVNGEAIPVRFTADGEDISPPLFWDHLPEGTQEVALICETTDAAEGEPAVHWLIWGMEPRVKAFTEQVPRIPRFGRENHIRQGKNDFGIVGWNGPKPPAGKTYNYEFTVYALSESPMVKVNSTKDVLEAAMQGKILGKASLVGSYSR